MSLFSISGHVNGQLMSVSGQRSGGGIALLLGGRPVAAASLDAALRLVAQELGPQLERAQRTSSAWGVYVAAGTASALFGDPWPLGQPTPAITGPPPKRSAPVARIHDAWRNRDGSPLGALEAALKIIEAYAERGPQAAAA
jgi:hypothetical protein